MTAPKRQYSDEEKKFLFQGFTFQGRMFFPELLTPKPDDNGRLKFGLACAWGYQENPAEMARFNQFWEAVKGRYFQSFNPLALVNPIKRDDTYFRKDGKPNHKFYKDCFWMNPSSGKDYQPQIVSHPTLQPCLDPAEIYSGRNVVIQVSFYLMEGPKQFGLGVNINAVMLMPGGERETGGAAPIDIASVFGSFAGDMNRQFQGQQPAPQQNFQAPPQQQQQQWNPNQQAAAPQQQAYNPQQGHGYNPNQGNGAQQGMNGNGQQNPGNQTQGYPQGGYGQAAPQPASPSNGQQQWQPFGNQGPQNTQQAAPPQAQGWDQNQQAPQQQQAQQWNPNQQGQGGYSGKY